MTPRKSAFDPASVPEPPELTEQCAKQAAVKAAAELAASARCATCGKRRDDRMHDWSYKTFEMRRCLFVEMGGAS